MKKSVHPFPMNPDLLYVIKHYDDGHYYYNVYERYFDACGRYGYGYRKKYVSYERTSLWWLKLIGIL